MQNWITSINSELLYKSCGISLSPYLPIVNRLPIVYRRTNFLAFNNMTGAIKPAWSQPLMMSVYNMSVFKVLNFWNKYLNFSLLILDHINGTLYFYFTGIIVKTAQTGLKLMLYSLLIPSRFWLFNWFIECPKDNIHTKNVVWTFVYFWIFLFQEGCKHFVHLSTSIFSL